MVRRLLILLLIGALIVPALNTGAAGRTETQTYVAGAFGATASPWCFGGLTPVAENIGGGCFDVKPGETSVTLEVIDFTLGEVGYMFRMVDRHIDTQYGAWQLACGSTTIPVPAGTDKIDVAPLAGQASPSPSPDGGADACGLPSNWGSVTATFS